MKQSLEYRQSYSIWFPDSVENSRWVLLEDAVVIIRQYNQTHYTYKQFDKIFESDALNNHADQMMDHLKLSGKNEPNILWKLTEALLPYVNGNIKCMNGSIHNIKFAYEKLMTNIKDNTFEIIGVIKTEINSTVKEGINNDLIINSSSLLKYFKTEASHLCSCISTSLMATP